MTRAAVTNSTCLIALERIKRLDLLPQCFDTVVVPVEVREEFGASPDWLHVRTVENVSLLTSLKIYLHIGEAAAIALAVELPGTAVILDDRKARAAAARFNIPVIGTIGLLLRAKNQGVLPSIAPLLDELRFHGLYVTAELRAQALRLAGELT